MSYYLNFYTLATKSRPDHDPDSVYAFIQKHGQSLGAMEFRAAECILFLQAVEDLSGQPATDLFSSVQFGVKPSLEEPIFGGLSAFEAERIVRSIDALLRNPKECGKNKRTATETAKSYDLNPRLFPDRLEELREILNQAVAQGLNLFTRYE